MKPLHLRLLPLIAVGLSATAALAQMPKEIRATLEAYCFDCHDDATHKAKLSLETLIAKPDARTAMATWTRVHDQLAEGEMPPAKKPQPTAAERRAITGWLRAGLHASSLQQQQREGRVLLRRMNRTEYENTLRDLFGVFVSLREMLPEDTTVAGFDNVSTGLETSAAHLVRYQRAADRAIAAALTARTGGKQRMTGREWWSHWFPPGREDMRKSAEVALIRAARLDGDTFVIHQRTESNGFLEFEAGGELVHPGRYRLRASVAARNTGGKPLPVLIFTVGIRAENDTGNTRIIAVRDAPPDTPAVIEEEFVVTDNPALSLGKRVALKGWTLPMQKHPDDIKKDIAAGLEPDFSGPALAVDWVEMEGPLGESPSPGYRRMFGELPLAPRGREQEPEKNWRKWHPNEFEKHPLEPQSADPKADAARLIRAFLPAAFRRPVDDATAAPFVQFALERIDRGDSFSDAMKAAYRNVLCSPHFLMLLEKPGPLDDYALASRLSYFLWSSRPDDALLARAASGELRKPQVLRAETERMLGDAKAQRFTENFTGQWLDLRKLHMTKPDVRYVEFDDQLLWSMPRETTAFFNEMLARDRSVTAFVWSDWTFLDRRLAQHYGVPGVDSWELKKTALPPDARRGGVLTHASILKVTANGTTTSPILRGKWVLEKLIGKPPAPPPPDIPALEPDIRGATTIRQQLDKHRNLAACASCHTKIDPPGFALETYDVIGGWRDWYRGAQDGKGGKERVQLANYPGQRVWRGPDVEKGFITADGRPFGDLAEYQRILLENPDQLARSMTQKLLIYATGAEVQFADREVVEQIVRDTRAKNYGLRTLLHAVVQSRSYLNK